MVNATHDDLFLPLVLDGYQDDLLLQLEENGVGQIVEELVGVVGELEQDQVLVSDVVGLDDVDYRFFK